MPSYLSNSVGVAVGVLPLGELLDLVAGVPHLLAQVFGGAVIPAFFSRSLR